MSADNKFLEDLVRIFREIYENKNLVIARKTTREDFRHVDYLLPDFNVMSNARGITISFMPNVHGENLSERIEAIHRHEYAVYNGRQLIGMMHRSPKKEFYFFTKPYNAHERHVDNVLHDAISQLDNITERFEPGLTGEVR